MVKIEPILESKKSKVTVMLNISYPEARPAVKSFVVYVDISEDQIEKFNEALEEAKALMIKELDDMKSELRPLQTIYDSLEISLDDILKKIYDETAKFFEADLARGAS